MRKTSALTRSAAAAELLDRAEDAYDDRIANLDTALDEMAALLGPTPLVPALSDLLSEFRVHYVLNQFDGVEKSHERAVVPFVRDLAENVSGRLDLTQLGWVVADERLHRANCSGRPYLLEPEPKSREGAPRKGAAAESGDRVMQELASLRSAYLGIERRPPRAAAAPSPPRGESSAESLLDDQLESLRVMFGDRRRDSVRDNFDYCVFRALGLMKPPRLPTEFGMTQVAPPAQLVKWLLRRLPGTAAASV